MYKYVQGMFLWSEDKIIQQLAPFWIVTTHMLKVLIQKVWFKINTTDSTERRKLVFQKKV